MNVSLIYAQEWIRFDTLDCQCYCTYYNYWNDYIRKNATIQFANTYAIIQRIEFEQKQHNAVPRSCECIWASVLFVFLCIVHSLFTFWSSVIVKCNSFVFPAVNFFFRLPGKSASFPLKSFGLVGHLRPEIFTRISE